MNALTQEIQSKSQYVDEQLLAMSDLQRELRSMKGNLNSLLNEMSKENDATLRYHGVNPRIRTLIDQQRYRAIYKDLPLEKRLDAIEKDLCKVKEELERLNKWVSVSCTNDALRKEG